MPSKLKYWMAEEYTREFSNTNALIFFDYQKISAIDIERLRGLLSEQGVNTRIVRNRVFAKAMELKGIKGLTEVLKGPVAVAYGKDEGDVIAGAKILYKWHREKKSAQIKGGVIDGIVDGAEAAQKYRELKTRDEMLSILSGQILAMGGNIASQIESPGGKLASQIKKKAGEDE